MGYYTTYSLSIIEGPEAIPTTRPCKKCGVESKTSDDIIGLATNEFHEDVDLLLSEEGVKWYTHEGDMLKFSLAYPHTVFKLSGEGEERGDTWVKYFKNGKMQVTKAKIELADFDETKLA